MSRNIFFSRLVLGALCCMGVCFLAGCKATAPHLKPMNAEAPITTLYTDALADLNTILEVYLRPDYPDTYFYVKPVVDATGLSATGEIPLDITALVRDAVSQVYYKVHHVERYDETDIMQIQAELLKLQTMKLSGVAAKQAERPAVDYTIVGRIAQFDRNLESTSDKKRAMSNFGQGYGRTDINASSEAASRLSRLSISFSVFDPSGVSLPGKFGASMEVQYAKNGLDFGFAIFGNGLGFGTEATAMHGRHLALQMMTEFSVVQIIGRALNVPYWRVGAPREIFVEDRMVLDKWRAQYRELGHLLIPFMQAQCIACGDASVSVTGVLDAATLAAFDRFAERFGVTERQYPNFPLYKALESNRLLNTAAARQAWAAYSAYKNGGALPATPAVSIPPAAVPTATPDPGTQVPRAVQPARPAAPSPRRSSNYEDVLKDLI